ncbi:alpha/beta fold hydrolase [bacterium]|nr:alpha/beta fold hydrolase [bacterium]
MLALMLTTLISLSPSEQIHVVDQGEGPPAVMVAGLSGCAYSYRNVSPLLNEAGWRTIAIDPLAAGMSSRPEGALYTLTAQAERLAAVADSLGVHEAVWVAQGVHASTVYRVAIARPDLVRGIVSLEGGPIESVATPGVRTGLKLAKLVSGLGGKGLIRDRLADGLRDASGDDSWVTRTTVRKYFRGAMRDMDGTLDAFLAMTRQAEPTPLIPELSRIEVPVLLLIGESDHEGGLAPEELEAMHAHLTDLTVEHVPGAGHFLMEERPDVVAEAVMRVGEATAGGVTAGGASAAPSGR